ncbi:hypothetical protein [Clostridium polynesiense]|uniref:hypothetical protein n=1 Tax=Clostridium polynesiense TaxID=1325933 RepID=UPI00058C6443|nr:hypothetical protein [Clostridium polynesiense]
MENKKEYADKEFTYIAKGICFGSAAGVLIGAIFTHPAFGMTLGAVAGVVAGEIYYWCQARDK